MRSIVADIQIAAPPAAVWTALTSPVELERWFPLQARVDPGVGGRIWLSWGEPIVSDARIEAWDACRMLRSVESKPLGSKLHPQDVPAPPGRTIEYVLQPDNAGTRVRLTHSGFPGEAEWDVTYNAVRRGWEFQLRSLRHYLERHRGSSRSTVLIRRTFALRPEDVWPVVMGPEGVGVQGLASGLKEGDLYSARAATGDALHGAVQICDPPHQWAATAANLNDAFFRITIVSTGPARTEASLWLAAYGLPAAEVAAFERCWADLLDERVRSSPPPSGETRLHDQTCRTAS